MTVTVAPPPDDPKYAAKVQEFRSKLETALGDIAARTGSTEQRCLILSGGVDTCAILAAARAVGLSFAAAVTVACNDGAQNLSPDRAFALAAAQEHDLTLHVVSVSPRDLVETYLPPCVKCLNTFDGMTLRNSLVVAAAFHKVSQLKGEGGTAIKHVVVGDGADELLGGYSFMWGCEDDPVQWKDKRNKMCANWTFATEALAKMYGLTSHGPYLEPAVVEWVLSNTERSDCIATRPIRLVHGGEPMEHVTGKLLLRDAYKTVASWRRKDPIELGSGVTVIGHDEYWKDVISDGEFQNASKQLLKQGFVIKSKEYLVNFRAFERFFRVADGKGSSPVTDNASNEYFHPTRQRLGIGEGCAGCCFEIGDKTFCDICGAYPAQRR